MDVTVWYIGRIPHSEARDIESVEFRKAVLKLLNQQADTENRLDREIDIANFGDGADAEYLLLRFDSGLVKRIHRSFLEVGAENSLRVFFGPGDGCTEVFILGRCMATAKPTKA